MGSADGYVDNSDLVFNLTHHDAQLASMPGHPVKHTGCRAHRIGTVKTDACGGSTQNSVTMLTARLGLAGTNTNTPPVVAISRV